MCVGAAGTQLRLYHRTRESPTKDEKEARTLLARLSKVKGLAARLSLERPVVGDAVFPFALLSEIYIPEVGKGFNSRNVI